MILYHGSNVVVEQPRLVEQNRFLDFGYGFYTTTNKEQALEALKIKKLFNQYVFATKDALALLKFVEAIEV